MITLDIQLDRLQERQLLAMLKGIDGGRARAIHQATQRTTRTVRSRIVGDIAKHLYKVRNRDLFDPSRPRRRDRPISVHFERLGQGRFITGSRIEIRGQGTESGTFATQVRGRAARAGRLPLSRFGARQTNKGVSYKILASGGRRMIPGAFLATMPTGHEGVFIRPGREGAGSGNAPGRSGFRRGRRRALPPTIDREYRLPIAELFGPSIPHVASQHPGVRRVVSREAPDRYLKELAGQVNRLVERQARKGV